MATVGLGFIILAIVWILCILLCLLSSRSEGSSSYIGALFILLAVIITLVLCFYPRGTVPDDTQVVYDHTYIRRTLIVIVLGVMLFIGLIVVAMFHVFEQRRGRRIKPWTY